MKSATVTFVTLKKKKEALAYLSRSSIFHALPESENTKLAETAQFIEASDGQTIFLRGAPPTAMYAVLSGTVRVTRTTEDGREALLALIKSDDWFGESSLIDGLPRPFSATTQGETKLLELQGRTLHEVLRSHPRTYQGMATLLCKRIRLSLELLESNAIFTTEERLAKRLLLMQATPRFSTHPYETPSELRVSQEDLSHMLGVTRQSINRILKTWERQGLIRKHYGAIQIIDDAILKKLGNSSKGTT